MDKVFNKLEIMSPNHEALSLNLNPSKVRFKHIAWNQAQKNYSKLLKFVFFHKIALINLHNYSTAWYAALTILSGKE